MRKWCLFLGLIGFSIGLTACGATETTTTPVISTTASIATTEFTSTEESTTATTVSEALEPKSNEDLIAELVLQIKNVLSD